MLDASELERGNWKLLAGGKGIQWARIREDISVVIESINPDSLAALSIF